jgi:carboxyl-terminal processing protease
VDVTNWLSRARAIWAAVLPGAAALVLLSACGGGSGGGPAAAGATPQACSAFNPYLADAEAPTTLAGLTAEKDWLLDYFNRQYLWFNEIPVVDPSLPPFSADSDVYGSLDNYFKALRTPAVTPLGKRKDQFSFTYPTRLWKDLSQSGTSLGYGIEWSIASPNSPPRGIRIAYVHAGSAAGAAGLRRGDTLISADGVSADTATPSGIDALNAALFPPGGVHSFVFSRTGVGQLPGFSFVAGPVQLDAVSISKVIDLPGGQRVGYLVFNDHLLPAEQALIDSMAQMQGAGVSDLVLDLRYNGGGYLFLASELAYMIAGPARTANQLFERSLFNSKRQAENDDTLFLDTSCFPDAGFQCTKVAALPTLNLARAFVIVGGSTCSASEAIINGLRGVDVDVRLIGSTTCGKPYGFFGRDNCGITYFPIEFSGVNAKGFGDYADGFVPAGNGATANNVPGCVVSDDLDNALGDLVERRLAAALQLRGTGSCPPVAAGSEKAQSARAQDAADTMPSLAARSNRIATALKR